MAFRWAATGTASEPANSCWAQLQACLHSIGSSVSTASMESSHLVSTLFPFSRSDRLRAWLRGRQGVRGRGCVWWSASSVMPELQVAGLRLPVRW